MGRARRREADIEALKLAFIAQAARSGAQAASTSRASTGDARLAELLAAAASDRGRGGTARDVKAR